MKIFLKYFPYFLLLYHLAFAWLAYDYVNQNNGDAVKYWFTGVKMENLSWGQFLQPGTSAIYMITYPLVKFLKLSPLVGCFLFSVWSGIGFWKIWKLIEKSFSVISWSWLISVTLIMMPTVHFWTSLIGKEALLFPFLVFVLEKLYQKQYQSWLLYVSLFAIVWVRPHLGAILIGSFGISYVFLSGKTYQWKMKLAGILLSFAIASYFLLEKITHAKEGLFLKISNLYAAHNEKLKSTSAYVPMDKYGYPYKLFTIFFRPLPFEKSGILYTIVSLENTIILAIFGVFVFRFIRSFTSIIRKEMLIFLLLFCLIYGTLFSYGYANFGLLSRTKSLLMPFGLMAIIIVFQNITQKNIDSPITH